MHFVDRVDAGRQLAEKLMQYKNNPDALVLGLPRGGMVTAFEVAQALNLPLDMIVTRKIGAPGNPELAVGALTLDGDIIWNESVMKSFHLKPEDVQATINDELKEAQRRLKTYRGDRPPLHLKDKIVILIDDGIATGATMHAAISAAKKLGAKKIVVGVPVGTLDSLEQLESKVDEVVCVHIPKILMGIGAFYEQFGQTSDEEVINLMRQAQNP